MKKTFLGVTVAAVAIGSVFFFLNNKPKVMAVPIATPISYFLFLSDLHLNQNAPTSNYGCDTGTDLWKKFLQKITSIVDSTNPPSFVILTGDMPAHLGGSRNLCGGLGCVSSGGLETHRSNDSMVLAAIRQLMSSRKIPFLYVPGNNDGLAGDYSSFADFQNQTPLSLSASSTNPYPGLNTNGIGQKIPCMISNPDSTMGYYSAMPIAGLRIIAMNTVMYSSNFYTADGTQRGTDRLKQMLWLGSQLQEANTNNERVYIAMHIPPGIDAFGGGYMWETDTTNPIVWQDMFLRLVSKYQTNIAGVLYGHTHMDELRRLKDSATGKTTAIAISCPGVTPYFCNNPGFKTVSFRDTDKALMNFVTYYTQPNMATWGNATYTFNRTYGKQSSTSMFDFLSKLNLDTLVKKMRPIYLVRSKPGGQSIKRGVEVSVVRK